MAGPCQNKGWGGEKWGEKKAETDAPFFPSPPLILAGAGHFGPSLHSFRLIFPSPPLILAGAGHLGPSLPFRSSHLLPFPTPAPCHPLFWRGRPFGPSLPSFRSIFPLPTPYSGRGRPFRSVSALSFVPPFSISHPCTPSPLILAGAGDLGPSLLSFRPIFPHPTPYSSRGPSLPFRSSHLLPFPTPAPWHLLFWQGPAI